MESLRENRPFPGESAASSQARRPGRSAAHCGISPLCTDRVPILQAFSRSPRMVPLALYAYSSQVRVSSLPSNVIASLPMAAAAPWRSILAST